MFVKTAFVALIMAAAMGTAHAESMEKKTDDAMHDMEMVKKDCMMKAKAEADSMKHDQMVADCMADAEMHMKDGDKMSDDTAMPN